MSLREARARLGELAEAAHHGDQTIVTKHGKPYFRIVPLEDTMTMTELRDQITRSLTDQAEGIDVDAVAEEIRDRYGVVDIDTIDSGEYWSIVRSHDATQQDA